MKKGISSIAVALALTMALGVPALACGGHHGGYGRYGARQSVTYSTCTVDNCISTGLHHHNGVYYNGHVGYCTLEGCTETAAHLHDGVSYGRHISSCGVYGCSIATDHLHDGTAYCGHNGGHHGFY